MSRTAAMADTMKHAANQRGCPPMMLTGPNVMGVLTMNEEGDLNEPHQLNWAADIRYMDTPLLPGLRREPWLPGRHAAWRSAQPCSPRRGALGHPRTRGAAVGCARGLAAAQSCPERRLGQSGPVSAQHWGGSTTSRNRAVTKCAEGCMMEESAPGVVVGLSVACCLR